MPSSEFNKLRDDITWNCFKCQSTNNSSLLYQYNLNISNSYEVLANVPGDDSVFSLPSPSAFTPGSPLFRSSPRTQTERPPAASSNSYPSNTSSTAGPSFAQHCSKPTDNLRFVIGNVNSIRARKAEIIHLTQTTSPDLMMFCETKIDSEIFDAEFTPPGYKVAARRDRTQHGGGVIIIAKTELVIEEIEFMDNKELNKKKHHDELIWAKLTIKNTSPVYLGCYYRPSSNYAKDSISGLKAGLEYIHDKVIKNNTRSAVFVGGDFNTADIDWEAGIVSPSNSYMKTLAENLLSTLSEHSLEQMQHKPTWQDRVDDLFVTNKPSLVSLVDLIPGFSDHSFIVVDTTLSPVITKKPPRKIYQWSKAKWDKINEATEKFSNDMINSELSVDELYDAFTEHVKSITTSKDLVPFKWTSTRFNIPWLTPALKRQCNKKQRWYNKARRTQRSSDWQKYNEISKECKRALNQARWRHVNKTLTEAEEAGNSKPFWRYIKSQRQDTVGVSPLKDEQGYHSDSAGKAASLLRQFSSVFTIDSDDPLRDATPDGAKFPPIDPLIITDDGVLKLLEKLNPSKAGGPDEIPARFLKGTAEKTAPFLAHLFRKSLENSQVPSAWRKQWVSPIYKKGARCDPANYRPVSLTCHTAKMMEHIVCKHIRKHLAQHDILSPFQHGFRSKHSCETQLLITTHDIASIHDESLQCDIGVLDFSKAFDTVPHHRLSNKLEHYGIDGKILGWINAFLNGRTQQILVDGVISESAQVKSGVPQGTVLGPLLFSLYINDLPDSLSPGTRVRLFADDCLVYRAIRTVEDQLTLQRDIDSLLIWADKWGMRFNPSKCCVLRTTGGIKSQRFYHMKGHILKQETQVKYLGVNFSDNLKWGPHIQSVVKKANQKLGFIRRNLRGAPLQTKQTAYFSLVRSGMEYAAPIWDPHQIGDTKSLQYVQRQAARWVKSNYERKPGVVTRLLSELEWPPLQTGDAMLS